MSDYKVNTAELRRAAKELQTKAAEMRAAVAAVESAMAPARAMVAPRVANNISQWDALKSSLTKIFPEAESASTIISTTANDVDAVLGGG